MYKAAAVFRDPLMEIDDFALARSLAHSPARPPIGECWNFHAKSESERVLQYKSGAHI